MILDVLTLMDLILKYHNMQMTQFYIRKTQNLSKTLLTCYHQCSGLKLNKGKTGAIQLSLMEQNHQIQSLGINR